MALTLPYPDMDFVPLDILTAQEQDQLVANIEYIASQFPLGANNIAENAIIGTKINNGSVTELKLGNGAVTADKIGSGAVTNAKIANSAVKSQNIDFTTLVKQNVSTATTNNYGYIDFGTVRIQWKTAQITGLNTGAGGYNQWTISLPTTMKDANYSVICSATSDVGQVAGAEFKVYSRTTTTVGLNYNHTGAISSGNMTYSIFVIGMKP